MNTVKLIFIAISLKFANSLMNIGYYIRNRSITAYDKMEAKE